MASYASLHARIKEPLDNKWGKNPRRLLMEQMVRPQGTEGLGIEVENIDIKSDPNDASTSVEFLLSTLVSRMHLKPGQALALLSNGNKFLIHVIIKGLKGDYRPVVEWYKEVFGKSEKLLGVLVSEPEGTSATLQVLDIFKAGLYSKDPEVASWACKLLAKMAGEMDCKGMSGVAWDWFVAENGGLQGVLYCMGKNRQSAVENIVSVMCQFGRYNFVELFTHTLKQTIPDVQQYLETMAGMIQSLAEYKTSRDELVGAGVLTFWVDLASRKADVDNPNPQERTAALGLLLEIWLNFPTAVEEKAEYAEIIMKLMQRASRDRNMNLQMATIAQLFKLLETFAQERNPYAPLVYKSLTFSLVENHQKPELREMMLSNFKTVLESFHTIPVSILMDPLIKQIRTSDGVTFSYNLFDFEFLGTVARHPKLTIKNAIQTLDLLAKPLIYSQIFASCALNPFMVIANRFKSHTSFAVFMQKLTKYVLGVYVGNVRKNKTGGGRSLRIKPDDKILMDAQNERVIELISKLISLDNNALNDSIKDCVLEANSSIKEITKHDDERLMLLLQAFGDAEEILNEYEKKVEEPDDDETLGKSLNNSQSSPQLVKRTLKHDRSEKPHHASKPPRNPQKLLLDVTKSQPEGMGSLEAVKSVANSHIESRVEDDRFTDRSVLSNKEIIKERDFDNKKVPYPKDYTIVPYKQLTLLEEKAILEIERVKQKNEERLQKRRIEENRKTIQEEKQRRALRKQLDIRKVEFNVATRNMKDMDSAMLLDEGVYEKSVPHKKGAEVGLRIIEDEEDRDYEALKLFVEQHKRVFRYLYSRYANSGFSSKRVDSFDQLKDKLGTISMAELMKMLKDHNVTLRMLSHSELASYIRLINFKLIKRNDLTALTFEGFIELVIQVAIYIFSKEPYNCAHQPPLAHVEALLEHFRQAAKVRGENTNLYDNPNATSLGDPELIQELTKFLETNPFYPLPEGYKKVEEKFATENYIIPNYVEIPESTKFATELLDSILSNAVGVHVLEPITTYEYKTRVVPTIGKLYQRDPAEKRFMMPLTKSPRKGVLAPVKHPVSLKQLNMEEIKPKLTLAMKLEVARANDSMKLVVKEVADVVGEIIQAVEEGRNGIGNRLKWGPSSMLNNALKEKLDRKRAEETIKEEKEHQRKLRAVAIKNAINEMKLEKAKRTQEEMETMKKQKEEEKKKVLREKQLMEERKKKLIEEKQRREEETKKRQEEENEKNKEERKKKIEELRALKKRKKEQFEKDLKSIIETREKAAKEKEDKQHVEQVKKEKHKKYMSERLARDKEKREESKQQWQALQDFMKRGDIVTTLVKYRKQLRHIFGSFTRVNATEITHDLTQEMNTLDLSKFSKLCVQFKLTPQLMSADDTVSIFRSATRAKAIVSKEQGKLAGKDTQYIEYPDFEELLTRVGLVLKNRLATQVPGEGELNRNYETGGADASVVQNLLNYMQISPDDNKITLDQKLNVLRAESKKPVRKPRLKADLITSKSASKMPLLSPENADGNAGDKAAAQTIDVQPEEKKPEQLRIST